MKTTSKTENPDIPASSGQGAAKKPAKTKTRSKLFFSGVMILTVSNIIIKAIGLLFKIPITNIIGDEGMGYFNLTYVIYVWFYMISTAGLPIAVSVMISESRAKGNIREVKSIFRITLLLFITIGFFGMSVMIFGSKVFAAIMATPPIYLSIIAIAPTLLFICVSSAIRGYFQGYQFMLPTAVSQIIEALGKLILGILFALYAMNQGYSLPVVAAYAISGLTIGAAAGMVFLIIAKTFFRDRLYDAEYLTPESEALPVRPTKVLLKNLVMIAIPITLSSSVMSLTSLIDGGIIVRCLKSIGYAEETAVAVYGNYTALAVPIFNLPPILIYPIFIFADPAAFGAFGGGDEGREKAKRMMSSAIKIVTIIITPCALGMSALSKPILSLFYKAEAVEMAAPLLTVLAPSIFFLGMLSITNAILQANGYERKPIYSMLSGAAVKLLSSVILISIPSVNIYGAPIGTFLCYLTITAINFYFLSKYVGITPKIVRVFVKPIICGAICAASAVAAYFLLDQLLPSKVATFGAIIVAAVIYLTLILLMRGISREDVELLPKGHKIYSAMHKLKLMK